jgi:hypothetical protein
MEEPERMKVWKFATLGAVSLLALCFALVPASADDNRGRGHAGQNAAAVTDLSSQTQRRRSRTRIEVYPERPPAALPYPRRGDVSWPGPGAVRDCVFRLEPEYRPSGTVIVPRQSCWWVRG